LGFHWLLAGVSMLVLAGCAGQARSGDNAPTPQPRDPSNAPPLQSTHDAATTLEELLQSDDFDLARGLLMFSERYYPEFAGTASHDTDINSKLRRFDAYSEQLRREINRDKSPRQRIRTLVDFIHVKLGLRMDQGDSRGESPENLFFDRVLQNRFGYCVTLSLAYIVFGQAAGLDVSGVRLPGHFAVLYKDTDAGGVPFKAILESTDFGDVRDEMHYWAKYRFSTTSVEKGVYLTPLSNREIFSTLYNNLAGVTYIKGNLKLAVERYNRALELGPNNAESMYNRAVVLQDLKEDQPALRDLNEAMRLDPNFTLALLARAGLLWRNQERDAARADLAEAMRKRPEWPQPHMMDGVFLYESGRVDDARQSFLRALELDASYLAAHIALAELEHAAGNHTQARKHEAAAGMNK
jgi:regulator of sirC expression with transglutaminase-like and TPR domain